jgi:hypothetical protein
MFPLTIFFFFFWGLFLKKSENNIITELIWTICDDSGVEVKTSVERFFEPTSGLFWLSDRLYRYRNDGSHFLKPSPLESKRQINSFFLGTCPPQRTEPEFAYKVKEPPVLYENRRFFESFETPTRNQRFIFENQRTTQHW